MTRPRILALVLASTGSIPCAAASGCTIATADGDACGSDCDSGEGRGSGEGDENGGETLGAGIPCAVADVLASACWECHGRSPAYGAPMSLASRAAFLLPARSDPSQPVHEVVAERVVDEVRPMPPTRDMAAADRTLLLDWIDAGLPARDGTECPSGEDGGDPDAPEVDLGCPTTERIRFLAHGPDDLASPFAVPQRGATDLLQCFAFASPFAPGTQATGWAPVVDDRRVLHHWILYRTPTPPPQGDGASWACDGSLQQSADFVVGWAPGGQTTLMPPDVGLDLGGPEHAYVLEVHYRNQAEYPNVLDRSGVEFCPLDQPRENLAGVVTLGTVAGLSIPPRSVHHPASGSCDPVEMRTWPDVDFRVLMATPHMHQLGRALTTELTRPDGSRQTITDVPDFSTDFQIGHRYDPPFSFGKRDTLTTTCYYDNPGTRTVGFGETVADEMCFNFALIYPIDGILDRNCGAS